MENSVKKVFACKCGKTSVFEFASELDVEDVTISANCSSCGANIMITMSALMKKKAEAASTPASTTDAASSTDKDSSTSSDSGTVDDAVMKEDEHVSYDSMSHENVNQAINDLFG